GGDCHGRSAVSPATHGNTTTQAERRRASRWRPEKVAPEDSGEGVLARLGIGEDAHSRPNAPTPARGSTATLVLGCGRDAVGGAIHESECLWDPCARLAIAAARRRARQREAEEHEVTKSACGRWRRRSHARALFIQGLGMHPKRHLYKEAPVRTVRRLDTN
ncbi:hypothetical protein ZWY2020_011097, partial [Hordeum vulgare]